MKFYKKIDYSQERNIIIKLYVGDTPTLVKIVFMLKVHKLLVI